MDLFEVWLIDTGCFLVLRDIPDAWKSDDRWVKRMTARRVLRMFVPESDLSRLSRVSGSFAVTRGYFELVDAIRRHRDNHTKHEAALEKEVTKLTSEYGEGLAYGSNVSWEVKSRFWEARDALKAHRATRDAHNSKALDIVENYARLLPTEAQSPIKQVPGDHK